MSAGAIDTKGSSMSIVQKVPPTSIPQDGSCLTPLENYVHSIEEVISSLNMSYSLDSSIKIGNSQFRMRFMPRIQSKQIEMHNLITFHGPSSSTLSSIFGVAAHGFIIVASKSHVDDSDALLAISAFRSANLGIFSSLPVFVRTSFPKAHTYIGFQPYESGYVIYRTSHLSKEKQTFSELVKSGALLFSGFSAIQSDRISLAFSDFPAKKQFSFASFFYKTISDPIECIDFIFEHSEDNGFQGIKPVEDSVRASVSIRTISSQTESMFDKFISFCNSTEHLESWPKTSSENSSQALSIIESVFSLYVKNPIVMPPIAGAPHGSIIETLACEAVRINSIEELSALWLAFIERLKEYSQNSKGIPSIGIKGPNIRCCSICQKVQSLNLCIYSRNAGEMPPIFVNNKEVSISDANSVSLSGSIQKVMEVFKKSNPASSFEDFFQFYISSKFDSGLRRKNSMLSIGNLKEMWSNSNKVAENAEVDIHGETEELIKSLRSMSPFAVCKDLIATLFGSAFFALRELSPKGSSLASKTMKELANTLSSYNPASPSINADFLKLLASLQQSAKKICCVNSLQMKLSSKFDNESDIVTHGFRIYDDDLELQHLYSALKQMPNLSYLRDCILIADDRTAPIKSIHFYEQPASFFVASVINDAN